MTNASVPSEKKPPLTVWGWTIFLQLIISLFDSIPRYQQFETQIRQMKVKKANYQHSLDRAAVLNPDEDIDVHDSKLSKSVLDLDKKIQRLEKKQKAIGDSLKAIQSEVRWSIVVALLQCKSLGLTLSGMTFENKNNAHL